MAITNLRQATLPSYKMGSLASRHVLEAVLSLFKGESDSDSRHTSLSVEALCEIFGSVQRGSSQSGIFFGTSQERRDFKRYLHFVELGWSGKLTIERSRIISHALEIYENARACYETPDQLFSSDEDLEIALEALNELHRRASRCTYELPF